MYSVEEFFKKNGIKNLNDTLNEKTSKSSFENKKELDYINGQLNEVMEINLNLKNQLDTLENNIEDNDILLRKEENVELKQKREDMM